MGPESPRYCACVVASGVALELGVGVWLCASSSGSGVGVGVVPALSSAGRSGVALGSWVMGVGSS